MYEPWAPPIYQSTIPSHTTLSPMTLGWAVKRSAPRAYQRGSTPSRCTTRCATPLHKSCSRTLTQRQQRPSSQRTRIHGRSVVTYVGGWTSGGWWVGLCDDAVVGCGAQNNPRVAGIGNDHEVPLFEDGHRGAAALDRVQATTAPELAEHSDTCGHVVLLQRSNWQSPNFFSSSMSDANASASYQWCLFGVSK
jgi:hypothetical protein